VEKRSARVVAATPAMHTAPSSLLAAPRGQTSGASALASRGWVSHDGASGWDITKNLTGVVGRTAIIDEASEPGLVPEAPAILQEARARLLIDDTAPRKSYCY